MQVHGCPLFSRFLLLLLIYCTFSSQIWSAWVSLLRLQSEYLPIISNYHLSIAIPPLIVAFFVSYFALPLLKSIMLLSHIHTYAHARATDVIFVHFDRKAAGSAYHAELARQIAEFLSKPLRDGWVHALTDICKIAYAQRCTQEMHTWLRKQCACAGMHAFLISSIYFYFSSGFFVFVPFFSAILTPLFAYMIAAGEWCRCQRFTVCTIAREAQVRKINN